MEIIIALVCLAISTTALVLGTSMPQLEADPGGPALFPSIVAVITGLACLVFIAKRFSLKALRKKAGDLNKFIPWVQKQRIAIALFGLVILLPFMIDFLGFVVATFAFTLTALLVSGLRLIRSVVTSVLVAAGVYGIYAIVLGAILPTGLLFT